MNTRKPWLRWMVGVMVVVPVSLFFWLPAGKDSAPLPIKWKPQPDSFPLGTVLQGSTVEMSLGLLSDIRPPQPPSWVSRLPEAMRRWVMGAIDRRRADSSKHRWQIRVDAPDFLRVDQTQIEYHSRHGSFPTITLRLATHRPGSHDGRLTIRLVGHGYGSNTVLIPVSARVLAQPPRWTVLMTETPFERYATGNGRDYEPLSGVTTRLAERGVRVDFLHRLPKSLDGWNVVLLGGGTLVRVDAENMDRLQQFVIRGGRLIVSADAFFHGTAAKANDLLSRYGLRIDNKDAGQMMQASRIAPDSLTAGVSQLSFWRPACVSATDSQQAQVLAAGGEDERCGFIAVSRAYGRGEVILLAQSLWWNWIRPDRDQGENARMLENLLAPAL